MPRYHVKYMPRYHVKYWINGRSKRTGICGWWTSRLIAAEVAHQLLRSRGIMRVEIVKRIK